MNNEHIKAQWIYIHRPSCKNVYVSNMYRLPNGDLKKAIMYLDECLMSVNVGKTNVFLLGDMNVNYKNKKSPNLKKNGEKYGQTNSLIDIALTNSKFISSSGTLDHFVSNHQPIYIVHKKSRDTR